MKVKEGWKRLSGRVERAEEGWKWLCGWWKWLSGGVERAKERKNAEREVNKSRVGIAVDGEGAER